MANSSKPRDPQINFRLPESLKDELTELAKREHWNLNQTMIEAVKLLLANKS